MTVSETVSVEESIPLQRLIKPREVDALLGDFKTLAPDADLALLRLDGRLFAGSGDWPRVDLDAALARVEDGPVATADGFVSPLRVQAQAVGVVAVRSRGGDIDRLEAVARSLHHSLSLLVTQAVERRDVAGEALERYREVNLLYRISDAIGSRLDPAEIAPLVLSEARRIIQADVAVVLAQPGAGGNEGHVQASFGDADLAGRLAGMTHDAIRRALASGRPAIVTDLPAPPSPLTSVLCAPLKTLERVVGVVLMGRTDGRAVFTAGDEKLLMALAGQAAIAIEKARLHQEELQRQRLEEELAVGKRIQLSLLPKACPSIPGWEFAARYQAARQVGGDLYDFIDLRTECGRLGMVIADVTGKGVAAALFMAVCRTVLRMEAATGSRPADVLKRANRFIAADLNSTLFLSAYYASLDVDSGEMVLANGGHNWPLWYRAGGHVCEELEVRGLLLGAFEHVELPERRIDVAPGDVLVFFTDGVTEATDAAGEMFGEQRLAATIKASHSGSADDVARAIVDAVSAFAGDTPQSDDLTLFVVKRRPPVADPSRRE